MRRHFIQILDTIVGLPSRFLDNAKVYLDLSRGFGFRLSKERSELSEVDKIKDESTFTISVPQTPKNKIIFREFIFPNSVNGFKREYSIAARFGAMFLNQNKAMPVRLNDSDRTIDIQLIKDNDFWLQAASSLTINQLDFGSFTYLLGNIEDTWDNASFEEGDQGILFPLVSFNSEWTSSFHTNYYRVFLSVRDTLKKGFCKLGWELDFPLMETDEFSRYWWYALKEDFYDIANRGRQCNVRVRSTGNDGTGTTWQTFAATGLFYDNGSNWDTVGSIGPHGGYENNQNSLVDICWKIISPAPDFDQTVGFRIELYNQDDEKIDEETIQQEYSLLDDGDNDIVLKSKEFNLKPFEYCRFFSFTIQPDDDQDPSDPNDGYNEFEGARFDTIIQGDVCGKRLYVGDTFTVSDLIKDYSFLDFFKGVLALGQFKIQTSNSSRKVIVRPLNSVTIDGVNAEGFLSNEIIDLSGKVVKRSRVRNTQSERPRFLTYSFKSTNDARVKQLGFNNTEEPIYSRKVDLETGQNETRQIRNPFFEPTADTDLTNLRIPAMWDNDTGEESYEISPRIVYAIGAVKQTIEGDQNIIAKYTVDFAERSTMLYASQCPDRAYLDSSDNIVIPNQNIVYGYKPNDLYNKYLKNDTYTAPIIDEYLVKLSLNEFIELDFRKNIKLYYEGITFLAQLLSVKDFNTGNSSPTLIKCTPITETTIKLCSADYYFDIGLFFYNNIYNQLGSFTIDSLVIDGEQYISSPIDLGEYDRIDLKPPSGCGSGVAPNQMRNIVDKINSLKLDDFYAEISDRALCPTYSAYSDNFKYHTIHYSSKATFEVIFKIKTSSTASAENFARWTESANYFWNGSTWVQFTQANVFEGAPPRVQIV